MQTNPGNVPLKNIWCRFFFISFYLLLITDYIATDSDYLILLYWLPIRAGA